MCAHKIGRWLGQILNVVNYFLIKCKQVVKWLYTKYLEVECAREQRYLTYKWNGSDAN